MSTSPLTDAVIRERLAAVKRNNGDKAAAARDLGIPRSTLRHAIKLAQSRGILSDKTNPVGTASMPVFPDDDVPVEQIIETMAKRYQKRVAHHDAKQWFPVKIRDKRPIGLAFVGDPHVDDDGCNWPLLRRDIDILKTTPGVWAINIGDTTNNWVGRLTALYANQETSKRTGYKLARWLMHDAGVPWLLWLLGNHDAWNDGAEILHQMAHKAVEVFDWQARFVLTFPTGWECPIHAAHAFKGNSIYNPVHGAMRAAKFGQKCPRLLVQGHHHEYAAHHGVYEDLDLDFWAVKVRGYKAIDHHADRHGFGSNSYGATALAVIDPERQSVRVYEDLAEGVEFLTWARSR